jgi:hypothetical protein
MYKLYNKNNWQVGQLFFFFFLHRAHVCTVYLFAMLYYTLLENRNEKKENYDSQNSDIKT